MGYTTALTSLLTGGMVLSLGGMAACWAWWGRRLYVHFFPLFFLSITLMYLGIAPVFALYEPSNLTIESLGLASPWHYLEAHALLLWGSFCFFHGPLWATYAVSRPLGRAHGRLTLRRRQAALLALGIVLFTGAFLRVMWRYDLWYFRVGGEAVAEMLVGLPPADFWVFRLYQQGALFLIGVCFYMQQVAPPGRLRRWVRIAGLVHGVTYAAMSFPASRMAVFLTLGCIVGWWLATRPTRRLVAHLCMLGGVAVLAVYLAMVVVNLRHLDLDEMLSTAAFTGVSGGIIGDGQGWARLNGLDLMARLWDPLAKQGLAWGRAWQSLGWLVWRFVDPPGFDAFRLSLTTTAKGYLMEHYLGLVVTDYFSCALTDMFGNFHFAGFVLLGVVYGWGLAQCCAQIVAPTSGPALLYGLFFLLPQRWSSSAKDLRHIICARSTLSSNACRPCGRGVILHPRLATSLLR